MKTRARGPRLDWPSRRSADGIRAGVYSDEAILAEAYGAAHAEVPDTPRGWANRLIQGDNLGVMAGLRAEFAGSVDLVYIDPPFASGVDYEHRAAGVTAFSDTWEGGLSDYLDMLWERLVLIHDLLAPNGSLFVHVGWHANAHVRLLLDELFGPDRLVDEIVWHYQTSSGASNGGLIKNHATIFHYAKGADWTFNQLRDPWPAATLRKWQKDDQGRVYRVQNRFSKRYYIHPEGKRIDDVWAYTLASRSYERTHYPTQKPLALLERIVQMSSRPGDLVADFFCGSGTTLVAAESSGRRWIGSDLSPLAVQTARRRILALGDRRPFEVWSNVEDIGRMDVQLSGNLFAQLDPATASHLVEWGVDWAYDGIFRPSFTAYRTRRSTDFALKSDHTLPGSGLVEVRAYDAAGRTYAWSGSRP